MKDSRHGTLTGSSTVDTITITGISGATWMRVLLPQGTGDAYLTYATGTATAATPSVGGNGTLHLCPVEPATTIELGSSATTVQVKMISTAALPYSIHLY